jgi:hypothetical protein
MARGLNDRRGYRGDSFAVFFSTRAFPNLSLEYPIGELANENKLGSGGKRSASQRFESLLPQENGVPTSVFTETEQPSHRPRIKVTAVSSSFRGR